ncbi:acetyltransferase [Terriglobus roseus DSM 18391]|uniref:Acetyltransferase n=1 Tax=Terriglobus roseus (strain DSM 18391 / NRRL B-41598 / KBS 63) TaxID=926566 RepID=I3ZLT5_TERRK|nr:GNAT family N-acetyltransferase [Terriglobus roseus]AFL90203.1 acetyltransferase [Terriglobus roseus DSM 18391]
MSLTIRDAVPADVREMVALIRDLAIYEKEPDAAVATEADLLRDGFGPEPYFHCVMAEWDGAVAGFALFFFQYSTWEGRPALYLEDLFVREPFRKRGIGVALFQRLAQIALERKCTRFQWECLDWNQPALDFYESAGAKVLREWLNLRVTGEALERLAGASR